jgi:hypothetical protein
MDKLDYVLISKNPRSVSEDIRAIIARFNELDGIKAEKIQNGLVQISYSANYPYIAQISYPPQSENDRSAAKELHLIVDIIDPISVNLTKMVVHSFEYRVFSKYLDSYLPLASRLWDISFDRSNPKSDAILAVNKLKPLFRYHESNVQYGLAEDNSVHIVNQYLLNYYLDFGPDEQPEPEFSYKVADNVQDFVALDDVSAIPINFYKHYQKRFKIINDSNFDIDNPGRKIFVKPYILELNKMEQSFYKLSGEHSSLIYMDKIRKDETLEDTLERILQELGIAETFIRARVFGDIEFDRDKDGILTPRLLVQVFVDKIEKNEEIIAKSKRSWNSNS